MEPKPSRLPRRISVQPSQSSPLSSRTLRTDRLTGQNDAYRTREGSLRYDSELQNSSPLRSSSRDWVYRERETITPSWKTPSSAYPRCSGSYDRPVSGSFLGNRSRVSTASSQPSWYDPLERSQSTYTGLSSRQQDYDSKRPKLSYSGCTSLSGGRSTTSSYTSSPDSSSSYGQFSRTSSVFHGDLSRERERPRRPDTPTHDFPNFELSQYEHGSSDIAQSYLQDRVSSYAQGARPKDSSLSTVHLNSSISRQLPSQSSLFTRDSSRISRTSNSTDLRSSLREASSEAPRATSHSEGAARIAPRTSSHSSQRSTSDQTTQTNQTNQSTDGEGRRTTRHLLSRLASSMSSTFFSRRSSQDSLSGRSPDAEEASTSLHNVVPEPSSATPSSSGSSENRPSEPSQGFAFLRRRRLGISTESDGESYRSEDSGTSASGSWRPSEPSQGFSFLRRRRWGIGSDSDGESSRSEDSRTDEARPSQSWLPSSIRNRCNPLFSRRRRVGRDETSREPPSADTIRIPIPIRLGSSQEDSSLDEVHTNSQGAAAATSASSRSLDASSSSSAAAAIAETLFSRRNSGISGMLPSSLLQFSVPAALGSSLSDNVLITVDIVPSGRTGDEQESEKAQKSSRDPEKLKKIKESLLLEDSDEEGDLCRICQTGVSSPSNPFIEPCKCSGSLQYVHQDCMKKWLHAKINSGSSLETITTCELCKEKLDLNLEDFDIQELYEAHASERAEYEFISSGLYLVVLLHLCEQRFSDILGASTAASNTRTRVSTAATHPRARFINLARTIQDHIDDLDLDRIDGLVDTSDESDDDEGV